MSDILQKNKTNMLHKLSVLFLDQPQNLLVFIIYLISVCFRSSGTALPHHGRRVQAISKGDLL